MIDSNNEQEITETNPENSFSEFWYSLKQNKGSVIGLATIIIIVLIAALAPLISPHSPSELFYEHLRVPPIWNKSGNWNFILGTDDVGRDILSRLINGASISIFIGIFDCFFLSVVRFHYNSLAANIGIHGTFFYLGVPFQAR